MKKVLLPLGAFLLGAFLVWFFWQETYLPKRECNKNYPFLVAGIDCQNIDDVADQVENLHEDVQKIIAEEKSKGNIIRGSVFYRDLNTKRWFGVDDTQEYYPASLLKLPMALVYFKIAELQNDIFDQELKIKTEGEDISNSDQHYPPQDPLVPGNNYKIGEMIRHMLVYSDNAPFASLAEAAKKYDNQVFSDLGMYVPPAGDEANSWRVTPRNFANIFRMLFNASYLNVKYSNKVLELLASSTFKKGIVAGIPEGVKVAHKFGEATGMEDDNKTIHSLTLNDCGIVYKPENPFIICVMTEGKDFSQLETVIQKITKTAYSAL